MAAIKGPFIRRDRSMDRSDPYKDDTSIPEPSVCKKCMAVWRKGKWVMDAKLLKEVQKEKEPASVICPACRKIEQGYPCGIIYLSGDFLQKHKVEIINKIKNSENGYKRRNPLERIIRIDEDKDVISIQTTSEKLAQSIGRAVKKAHSGNLDIKFSHQEKLVRVYWHRD